MHPQVPAPLISKLYHVVTTECSMSDAYVTLQIHQRATNDSTQAVRMCPTHGHRRRQGVFCKCVRDIRPCACAGPSCDRQALTALAALWDSRQPLPPTYCRLARPMRACRGASTPALPFLEPLPQPAAAFLAGLRAATAARLPAGGPAASFSMSACA